MSPEARQNDRRGALAALLACLALGMLLAGCSEDRSNLIPADTSEELIARFDEVQALSASGQCFEAVNAADDARKQVEQLDENIDPRLKRSLIDGVTQLQIAIGNKDPSECIDSVITTPEEPVEEEPDISTGSTGTTGTTDEDENSTTTGDQGTTDEQDSEQPQNGPNGDTPPSGNPTNPTTPTEPTNPTTPPTTPSQPSGPGSGGLGPG